MIATRLLTGSILLLAIVPAAVAQRPQGSPQIEGDKPDTADSALWKPNGKPDSSRKRHSDARNPELSLRVYVRDGIGDSGLAPIRMLAQGLAYQMFAAAGVRIHWRTSQPKPYEPGLPILIDITSNTPETLQPGALAYAQVFEGDYIRIFYDRVKNPGRPLATATLLAHVMAHEITHILEGVDRHSAEGVMKAHWTADDLVQMAHQPLPFDPEDILLIQKGLANRGRAARSVPLGSISSAWSSN